MKRKPLPIQVKMVECLAAIEEGEKLAKKHPKRWVIRALVRLYTLRDVLKREIAKIKYEPEPEAASTDAA